MDEDQLDRERDTLFRGLSRVLGLPIETPFRVEFAAASRCFGRHYSAACTHMDCGGIAKHAEDIAYLRQSIPEEHALPEPLIREDNKMVCPCGQPIMHAHVIYRKDDPACNAIVGSCCIRKFLDPGRSCSICQAPHRNIKDNVCKACRKRDYCRQCKKRPSVCEDQLCGPCVAEAAREAHLVLLRRAKLCTQCEIAGVRPPYTMCYRCSHTGNCIVCAMPCMAKYPTCYGCKPSKYRDV